MKRHGQAAVEFLMLAVFLLALVMLFFVYANVTATSAIAVQKTQMAVQTLAKTADEVHALGPGSKLYAEIELPPGIKGTIMGTKEIGYKLQTYSGTNDIWYPTNAEIVGKLPVAEGKQLVRIEMSTSGKVRMGYGLTVVPDSLAVTIAPGNSDTRKMTMTNVTEVTLTGMTYELVNIDTYTTLSSTVSQLAADASDDFNADFTIPAGEPAQTVIGSIDINNNQGYFAQVDVRINIPSVLASMDVKTYSDANRTTEDSSFDRSETVYYRVRTFDQTSNPLDLSTLDVNVVTPVGVAAQQMTGESTLNGIYDNSYVSDTNSALGTWSIDAKAILYDTKTASTTFTLTSAAATHADCFKFDWGTASFAGGGKNIDGWKIENICSNKAITIDKMTVSLWSSNDNDNAKLSQIKLDNSAVWNGTATDGTEVDITDFSMAALFTDTDTRLAFSKRVDDDGENFKVKFAFTDGSSYTTTTINESQIP